MTEPSIAVVLGIIAVLKTGGCYLPIDPENPEGRIDYILNDSETGLLLTQRHLINKVAFAGEILDIEDEDLYREEVPSPGKSGGPDNPVYMIYTSGTTGTPKGVLVTHRNLVNYVTWFSTAAGISGEDKTPLTSSFAFDLGYTSVYPSLLAGGQLHLLSRESYMFAPGLLDYICSRRMSYVKMTPSLFSTIVEDSHFSNEKCKTLRLAVLGGEAIDTTDVEKAHRVCRHIKIMNHYGPTEVTIGSVAQFIDFERLEEYKTRPTIGRPIFNSKVFILDKYLKLLPLGIAGELCLSGVGVAKGYFKRDALTSEKFIDINTFMEKAEVVLPYDRVYRTGDLARWLPHRNIEFLHIIHHQVKIRGYRIELGEIEGQLLNHPAVKDTVVLVLGKNTADKYLCAYVVPGHAQMFDNPPPMWAELKKYLSHSLPGYMIPAHFMKIDKVPLTPNGKLDRRALPVPDVGDRGEYTPPGDAVEEQLVKIWADLLSIETSIIGIDADFFQLGGHSLKATIMAARIQDAFNVRFPLSEVFKAPTIRGIAEYTRLAGIGIVTAKEKNLVLLKHGVNSNHHLFLVHDGTGEVEAYMAFCNRLTDEFNYWGLRADRLENLAPQNQTIEALAQRYVEKMRKIQAHGPYYIAGWSLGGTIAFEMARQLEEVEEKIAFLALIDSVPPHKDLWKGAEEFNLKSELNFIKGYPIDDELKETLKKVTEIHQVWLLAADYLETKNVDAESVKQVIAADYGLQVLPNYRQLGIRESLYYLNVSRTLRNARASYSPSGKINTWGHFFKANQSRFKYRPWNAYCRKPFEYHKVDGGHYSIFRQPHAAPFAHTFNQVIRNLLKSFMKENE
jgi:amino acid adenylation domain-containing protein